MLNSRDAVLRWAVRLHSWQPDKAEWEFLLTVVGPDESQKVQQFRRKEDQKRVLLSRLLQLASVHKALGVPWDAITIKLTKGRKPYFVSAGMDKSWAPNFNFNVSHEGDFVVLASEPFCLCGVDVAAPQCSRSTRPMTMKQLQATFEKQLTASEWASVRRYGIDEESCQEAFQQFWSLKEAFVKARGDGLGFDLGRASFSIIPGDFNTTATVAVDDQPQPLWCFKVHQLGNDHWVSVARGPIQDTVDAWQGFTSTFDKLHLTHEEYQAALSAPWPAFSYKSVGDLLPAHLQAPYQDALDHAS